MSTITSSAPSRVGRALFFGLCALMALYSLLFLTSSRFDATGFRERLFEHPTTLVVHLVGGAVAIALGPLQFVPRLRRSVRVHRALGTSYVTCVLLSGATALPLAWRSEGGLVAHLGFTMLAVCWLSTTVLGWRAARRADFAAHRAFMMRSFALTFAAVMIRADMAVVRLLGLPFDAGYAVVSWMCWIPNLVLVEVLLRLRTASHSAGGSERISASVPDNPLVPHQGVAK